VTKPLRLLLIEDSDDDEILVLRCLRAGGYEPDHRRVDTAAATRVALADRPWDIVISDFNLPSFSAPAAFAILKETGLDIPFIIVSGTVGEDAAVEAMKAGVHDYIVKGNLGRLIPAVEREVREAKRRAEQAMMRERLVISERMASAGTLAAGVAHEINNPLAVLIGNLEFVTDLLARLGADARRRETTSRVSELNDEWIAWLGARLVDADEPLRDARDALERIREIVRDVKLFSRPQENDHRGVDVRRVIESSLRMASNEIKHRATLVTDYGDVPLVLANEARIGQVLLNLIVNAAQSMPAGRASKNEIRLTTRARDGYVIVEVRDTGQGIARENIDRVFDPFFTTKAVGIGTGLGLSICHRIVSDLGGTITVESEVGTGTTFRLTLPTSRDELAILEPSMVSAPSALSRRARVLVVDDEPAIGRALKRGLQRQHDVVVVASGHEAVALVVSGERFDVILSDLMMPEMTGMEMYETVARMAPEQAERIVFLSGGAFTEAAREFLERVPSRRLEKPVEVATLLALIAKVVG
jgi:signal transduction histidine kinase